MKTLSHTQTNAIITLSFRLSRILFGVSVTALYFIVSSTIAYAGQVTLGWDKSTASDVAGYKIYYGTASGNYSQSIKISSPIITTCTVLNLAEGQTYYFAATSYNSNLVESDYSAEISYTINPAATTSTVIETTTISDSATTTSTTIEPATTSEPETTSILTTSSSSTTISTGGGGHSGGSYTSTTTLAAASSTTITPAFTTTIPASTTIVPSYTTTTVFESECSIKSVKSTGLPLKSGLLNPRLRRIVITGINSIWNSSSEITIDAINLIITMRVEHDKITALVLIPPRQSGFQPGVKDVTIVTGSEICLGTLDIE